MRTYRRAFLAIVAMVGLVASTAGIGTAGANVEGPAQAQGPNLELYRATVDAEHYQALLGGGYDIAAVEEAPDGYVVEIVLSPSERNRLTRDGIELEVVLNADGLSASEAAARQRQRGYRVWRPWDGPAGLEDRKSVV